MMRIIQRAVFCAAAIIAATGYVQAEILTYNTSEGAFSVGSTKDQGWWSPTAFNVDANDSYFVGRSGVDLFNNFFTFNLSTLDLTGKQIVSATLEVTRFETTGDLPHTYQLFDVLTPAAILNLNTGSNAGIFADLGSGTSFGSFSIGPGLGTDLLSFSLNAAAFADIAAKAGDFFSIGGTLDLTGKAGEQNAFGFALGDSVQRLVLELEPQVAPVPAPASLVLWSMGGGLAFFGRKLRRRRTPSAQ
jgi:hypothetical protein